MTVLVLAASLAVSGSLAMAQTKETPKGPAVAPGETSDRTPEKKATTPLPQTEATPKGETSDRTPQKHGEKKEKEHSGTKQ